MINKKVIKERFNKSSSEYNNYAFVQKIMAKKLIKYIKNTNVNSILEIGCGTGILTKKLLSKYKNAKLTVLDISENMILECKKNLIKSNVCTNNIEFICFDGENYSDDKKYDLIISNATFQWFKHPILSIKNYENMLSKKGEIIISTFGENTFIELEKSGSKACKALNTNKVNFRKSFLCEKDFESHLLCENFIVKSENIKEYFDSSIDFLKSVRKIGANICDENNIIFPNIMKKTLNIYNENFKENNKVYATYHCIYLYKKK